MQIVNTEEEIKDLEEDLKKTAEMVRDERHEIQHRQM